MVPLKLLSAQVLRKMFHDNHRESDMPISRCQGPLKNLTLINQGKRQYLPLYG